ncbi:MAG: hypothetical protein M3Z08_15495 [Chloroflexota bacterium]|nr:hypothetical protein [Chloroflexota bacterium]
MPRGRKGPPQDSIDSILLAISRRNDIDPTTMEYYFERLDEEWTDGARAKVLQLLRGNDIAAHSAAIHVLSELATDFDLEDLEDFVTDPTVSDMAKLTLAPVLKELGSEMADEGIIEYLNDPEAAMLQMQMRLLELVGQSELGVEAVLEDVLAMPVERRMGFVDWLGRSHDPRAAHLLIPLLENQPGKLIMATIDALEQLGTVAVQQTIPALNYLLASSSNRALKQHARATLGRLTMLSAPGTEAAAMAEAAQQHLALYEARVSFIDGSGAQIIMISWRRPDGMLKGVNVLYQDQWGIKDCYGTDEMEEGRWSELVHEMEEQGFYSFQVPVDYCLALIAEAAALNKRTRHKVPIAYTVWRPLIGAEGAQHKNASPTSTALAPCVFDDELASEARRGAELYQWLEFASWMFEPLTVLQPYINRYWATYDLLEGPGSGRGRGRGRKGKQKEHQANLDTIVREALAELIDDRWRLLYEARLRRQGQLFVCTGRTTEAELIRAVAAALHPDSALPPQEQAFLHAMMGLSIQQGPFRMMIEALDTDDFGASPLDLFPPKR